MTEIGDVPLSVQVKLLTFLDDKMVYPLGGAKGFQANVRIIAATHRHLEHMVKEGQFREDLLYRLNVVRMHLPPLRDRGQDVELLMDHFLKLFSGRFGKRVKRFSKEVRQILIQYAYPGNVRELRNIIEYAANICPVEEIDLEHLPTYITQDWEFRPNETRPPPSDWSPAGLAPSEANPEVNWPAIEKKLILEALLQARGKRSKAAEILGWGRSTLWRKMRQYELDA